MSRRTLAYADFIIRWRWPVLLLSILAVVLLASGARELTFSTSYRAYFDKDNPYLIAQDQIETAYVKVDNVVIVVQGPDGDMFTPERLAQIQEITNAAWQMPYVIRVDSLTNYQHTRADGDDLVVSDLVLDTESLDAEDLADIRRVALSEPAVAKRLISADARTAAVVATVQFPPDSADGQPAVAAAARALRTEFLARHPDVRMALTGVVMMSNTFVESAQTDVETLFPAMGILLTATTFLFLGSVGGTVAALLLVGFSAAAAMGFGGYMGVQITPGTAVAPIIVLTIAIADSIHILVTLFAEMAGGRGRIEALRESLRINMQPVFLTSVTTAIGFLSLNFSDAPPFREFGNICAAGAIIAWALSVTFLPAAAAILPLRGRRRGYMETFALTWVARLVTAAPGRIVVAMGLLSVLAGLALPRIDVNDKFVELFAKGIEFRDDSDFISENLPGVYFLEYSIGSGEDGGIANPEYLARLGEFTDWLEQQPGVVHVMTVGDVMRRLNRSMHGDDPDWYRLPESRDLAAQYLLLYEMSLPYGLDLNNQIDVAKSSTRVTATLDSISSDEMKDLKWRADDWLRDNGLPAMASEGTGVSIIFSFLTQRNADAMAVGTAVALLLISACLFLALRSFKIGVVSLLPNLIPPVLAFGLWALIYGEIGFWSAMVTVTALGLIVDFTVHFLSKYLRGRRERGFDADESVRYAFNMVGAALWVTALVLIAGFSALMFSDFVVNAFLGIMVAIIISIALVTDFLFLPAVLLLVDRDKPKQPE